MADEEEIRRLQEDLRAQARDSGTVAPSFEVLCQMVDDYQERMGYLEPYWEETHAFIVRTNEDWISGGGDPTDIVQLDDHVMATTLSVMCHLFQARLLAVPYDIAVKKKNRWRRKR